MRPNSNNVSRRGGLLGLAALAGIAAALLAGCGAGGSGSSGAPSGTSRYTASARFVIRWPAAAPASTRLIPPGTQSVKIEIRSQTDGTDVVPPDVENAPGTGAGATTQHQFNGIPLGPLGAPITYNVVVTAYTQTNAQGAVLAGGMGVMTLSVANTPTNPAVTTVTLQGVIDHFVFSLAPTGPNTSFSIVQGQQETLVATAVDVLGNMVLLDNTKLSFVSSNPAVATVTQLNDALGNKTNAAAVVGGSASGGVNIIINYNGSNPLTGQAYVNPVGTRSFVVTAANGNITARFLYVVNSGSNNLSVVAVNQATGALSATGATTPVGSSPRSVAVTPTGQYVYVANSGGSSGFTGGTVSGFMANAQTGALTPASGSPAQVGASPVALAVDPLSRFLYVVNNGDNTISQFTIDLTSGFLLSDGPAVATGQSPVALAIDPAGKYVYVANSGDNTISSYSINATTGVLTPTGAATPLPAGASNPASLTVDATGKLLFVVNGSNSISGFTINTSTGALAPLGNAPTSAGPNSIAVIGQHLYVANRDANTITAYTVSPSGTLTSVTIPTGAGVSGPVAIAADRSGYFVYTANLISGNVASYAVDPTTGALTAVNTPVTVGSNPVALAPTAGASGSVSVTAQ